MFSALFLFLSSPKNWRKGGPAEAACRCHFDPLWDRLENRVGLVKRLSFPRHLDSCHCSRPQVKLKYFFKLAAKKTFCMKDKVQLKYIFKKGFSYALPML